MTTLRERFAAAAVACCGTRYQHQGRLPGVGLDCIGLAVCAARAAGVIVDDQSGYARLPSADDLTRAIDAHCYRIRLSEINVGDIIAFAWVEEPQHVAIVCSTSPYVEIVHAHAIARKVVRHIFDDGWRSKARIAYRLRDV